MKTSLICLISFSFSLLHAALPQKKALLIGVNAYQHPEFSGRGLNAIKGQQLLKSVLLEQGFSEANIDLISDRLATYDGIKKAFKIFAEQVKQGDIIVIHYYGHGTQIEDDNGDEVDKLDEAFIPFDGSMKNVNEYMNLIRDDELGYWVDNIRKNAGRSGQVLVLLDACHSGSGLRSTSDKRRSSEDINLDYATSDQNMASLVALYSSMPHQSSFEFKLENNERCALLTWAFCKALVSIQNERTYRNLFDMVSLNMAVKSRKQTPLIEGNINLEIFGKKVLPHQDYIKVIACPGEQQILIAAGLLKGIQAGAKVAVYNLHVQDTGLTKPITYGIVSGSMLSFTESLVDLNDFMEDSILMRSKVVILEQRFREERISLKVESRDTFTRNKITAGLSEINSIQFLEEGEVDLILKLENGKMNLKSSELGTYFQRSYTHSNLDIAINDLGNELLKFIKARFLRNLEVGNSPYQISCAVTSVNQRQQINSTHTILKIKKEKEIAELRITNHSKVPVYYTIIDIDPRNEITILIPGKGRLAEEYRLAPSMESPIHRVKFNALGGEFLIVIATPVPIDLRNVLAMRGNELNSKNYYENLLSFTTFFNKSQLREPNSHYFRGNDGGVKTVIIDVIDDN